MDDALYPVMGRDFWADAGRPDSPDCLTDLRLVHDRDPNASWAAWRAAHGPAGLNVRSGPRFASSDLVLRAAAQGLGVALARDRLAAEDLAAGALIRPFGGRQIDLPEAYWIVRPAVARVQERAPNPLTSWVASAKRVRAGQPVTLCYAVDNAQSVTIDPPVQELEALSRCFVVRPERTTTYTITVVGASGQKFQKPLTIEVE